MIKKNKLYQGKAKTIYQTDDDDLFIMHFRDDATAFNGVKHAELTNKGMVNNQFNAFIMDKLATAGIKTHFIKQLSADESLVHKLEIIPVECVVRNIAAGGLCARLAIKEGMTLTPPIFEFFYKSDELNDPMINESHILTFGWATQHEIATMKKLTFAVNDVLKPLFTSADMLLVDYKLEFGRRDNTIVLGDEFTPDGCRIWDSVTKKRLDKDRFRQDLGDVIESYLVIAKRLGMTITL